MHDEIIKFSLDGEIADTNIVQQRERLIEFVENCMREEGAVPVLDLDPQFTLDYDSATEVYKFYLTVYGVYLGKEEAWQVSGTTSGTKTKKYTPPIK